MRHENRGRKNKVSDLSAIAGQSLLSRQEKFIGIGFAYITSNA